MSETSTHTPGPWSFDRDWSRLPTIFGVDGKTKVATIEKLTRDTHTPEQEGDAYLIAAAPDLAAALMEIEEMPFSMANDSDSLRHTIKTMQRIAHRALAKAKV